MPDAKQTFEAIADQLSAQPGVIRSQMFGMPCLKIYGKAFAGLDQGEMVFKLTGDEHTRALAIQGAALFDPSGRGRPMKEWVRVPGENAVEWGHFANAAMHYVESLIK